MHVIFLWLMTAILTGSPAQQQLATQRFDYLVRADFFAGAAGDEARLARAMELCERTLADNPKHPEAMVWHGAGLLVRLPTQTLVGALAGVTHPAVLAYTTDQLEDERQLTLGYATVFPLAMIAKILLAQLLVTVLL